MIGTFCLPVFLPAVKAVFLMSGSYILTCNKLPTLANHDKCLHDGMTANTTIGVHNYRWMVHKDHE